MQRGTRMDGGTEKHRGNESCSERKKIKREIKLGGGDRRKELIHT